MTPKHTDAEYHLLEARIKELEAVAPSKLCPYCGKRTDRNNPVCTVDHTTLEARL